MSVFCVGNDEMHVYVCACVCVCVHASQEQAASPSPAPAAASSPAPKTRISVTVWLEGSKETVPLGMIEIDDAEKSLADVRALVADEVRHTCVSSCSSPAPLSFSQLASSTPT
jgi:hypothetical protein